MRVRPTTVGRRHNARRNKSCIVYAGLKAPFTLTNNHLTGLGTVPNPVWCDVNASDRARPTQMSCGPGPPRGGGLGSDRRVTGETKAFTSNLNDVKATTAYVTMTRTELISAPESWIQCFCLK